MSHPILKVNIALICDTKNLALMGVSGEQSPRDSILMNTIIIIIIRTNSSIESLYFQDSLQYNFVKTPAAMKNATISTIPLIKSAGRWFI